MKSNQRKDNQALIVHLLLNHGLLDARKMEVLREVQAKEHGPLDRLILKKGLATERDIAEAYAAHFVLPLFDPGKHAPAIDPTLCRLLPEKLCRDQLIAPVAISGDTLDIAFVTPNE